MKDDKKTISNQPHEIKHAAKHLGVDPFVISLAKYILKTSNREDIYQWVNAAKGQDVSVKIRDLNA